MLERNIFNSQFRPWLHAQAFWKTVREKATTLAKTLAYSTVETVRLRKNSALVDRLSYDLWFIYGFVGDIY
jgi:hypothetical protein